VNTRTVLVVDDEKEMRDLIVSVLRTAGLRTIEAANGVQAIDAHHAHQPDLILLDVGLRDMTGHEVCRRIRKFSAVPIVFLTGAGEEVDELLGFAAGGDDYIVKPVSPRLLLAHVEAQFASRERGLDVQQSRFVAGPIVLDSESRSVTVNDREVPLSRIEFDVLHKLIEKPMRVVRRSEMLEEIWGDFYDPHVLEVTVSRLRQKVQRAGGPRIAIAVPSVGYRLLNSA
jgi:DNA-binding response OmpR family regulator